ncbi:MAG TPA: tail fiber protein [Candidatus Limnocylindrales bacterium]|nr:tail fiber protein [Candidatus Limnocylindrales bacterium]
MSSPYVGEIRIFAGNFAPQGWALCDGQILPISGNEVLFNLIGTTYGGDGENTFALPDLRSRFPIHQGNGFPLAQQGGVEYVTLLLTQIPAHNHPAVCSPGGGSSASPVGAYWATDPEGNTAAYNEAGGASMAGGALSPVGGGQPHDNMSPFLVVNYIISLFGIFPSQT